MDISAALLESNGSPSFFRLQCPTDQEVAEFGTQLGNSHSKRERKVTLILTAVASVVFVKTGGRG